MSLVLKKLLAVAGAGVLCFASFQLYSGVGPGVHFIENRNQWPSSFLFGADFPQAKLFLKETGLYFVHYTEQPIGEKSPRQGTGEYHEVHSHGDADLMLHTFEAEFIGARATAPSPLAQVITRYNYFYGPDRARWGMGAAAFDAVLYKDLYEGIDLKVYSDGDLIKSDWILRPCADPAQIALRYKGVDDLEVRDGELLIRTGIGTIRETRPVAYQFVNGVRKNVACEYSLLDQRLTFMFPDGYDPNYELVIDPILIFSSYSGSRLDNWGNTATPDSKGNLYSGGIVSGGAGAIGFPVTTGSYQRQHRGGLWDIGILKYDSVGATLLYVTYLGGTGAETPQSLVVNEDDELLVLGATSSGDFPVTTATPFKGGPYIEPLNGIIYNSGTDMFVARFSENGSSLLASTFLGGTGNDAINFISGSMEDATKVESPLARNYGDQLRGDIITDSDGYVYIASSTRSLDFPIVNSDASASFHGGTHDGVVAKLTPDLSTLVWSRTIGGSLSDVAFSIKLTSTGRIYAAGGTNSSDLLGMTGLNTAFMGDVDGWIVELSPDGSQIVNGTYLGTTAYDQSYFIDIATNGDVLAYGQTQGQYPLSGGTFVNLGGGQFLHRLRPDLKTTVFSTTFGSGGFTPNISPTAFLVNDCDNIYMSGWGGSINNRNYFNIPSEYYVGGDTRNLPITPDAYQKSTVLGNDFYMMVLTGDAKELVYATYLGGTTSLTHVDGGTSRFDKRGIVYHAVCADCGAVSDFPAVNVPPERMTNKSPRCSNAAFKFDLSALRARIQTNNITLSQPGFNRVCMPDSIVFQNRSLNGQIFEWDLGDGTRITKIDTGRIAHLYRSPGQYTVKLKAIDYSTCIARDSTIAAVDVFKPEMSAGPGKDICLGSTAQLTAGGGTMYSWRSEDNSFQSALQNPIVDPEDTTSYFVTITDVNGCIEKDTVVVNVAPGMELKFEVETTRDCLSRPYVTLINLTEQAEGEEVMLAFGDGFESDAQEDTHTYERDGVYSVGVSGRRGDCVYENRIELPVVTISVPNVITPIGPADGRNDVFSVTYGDPPVPKTGITVSLRVVNRWGKEVYRDEDYKDDWAGEGVEEGVYYYELDVLDQVACKGWVHVIK